MAADREHSYEVQVEWTGNLGKGTSEYTAYSRAYDITTEGKPVVPGSADPAFRGDSSRYNPEELLVSSLSSCHMLWYLHLCSEAGIVVLEYVDKASGIMVESTESGGRFKEVVLRPHVTITEGGNAEKAAELHERAHDMCFVANSVNFPVRCEPVIGLGDSGSSQ